MRTTSCSRSRGRHRRAAVAAVLALVAAMVPAVTGMLPTGPASSAQADEVTASQDALRTGWDPSEPGLSPTVVAGGGFGQLFSTAVNGTVYAQPLVAGSTVVVATETNWVYGLDAQTGAVRWSRQLGAPWPTSAVGCQDVGPTAGVTGTPVYDAATGDVYAVSESVPPGGSASDPVYDLVGLDAQTGQVTLTVPVTGSPVNDPLQTFDAFTALQRPALLLMNGSVYAAFGSHCDFSPYAGYVAGVNLTTSAVTLWSDEAGVSNDMGGIWQSGGGLMSDGSGRIFFASGNGVSPPPGPGTSPPPELAESVVRLGVQPNGSLAAQDFFSPANAPTLDAYDQDFGSGAPVGLPVGTAAHPGLLVQAGKDGRVFVLDRNNLGGREQGPNGTDAYLAEAGPFKGQWGHPAVFEQDTSPLAAGTSGGNDYVYYLGNGDHLRALQLGADANGLPTLTDVADSAATFGYGSGSPVVTSNGTSPSSAVVWVIGEDNGNGTNGTLYAFDAIPQLVGGAPTLQQIWSAPIGTATKFSTPATNDGKVYVATRDGHVLGFGSPDAAPLTGASPLSFGTAVGTSQTGTATGTATAAVNLAQPAVSATGGSDPFSAGQASVNGTPVTSFPVALSPGDQVSVPVTFTPAGPGGATGALTLAATSPDGTVTYPPLAVSLAGTGTAAGLSASPGTLAFGTPTPIPVGESVPLTAEITNYGTASATVTGGTAPSGPYHATLPAAGTTIAPGKSVPVTVTYTPTAPSSADQGSFTIDGSTGNVTVGLSGTSVAAVSAMTASPATVGFGQVPLGQQATTTIAITNTGNLPGTVKSSTVPDMPFGTPSPVAAKLPVNPGYDLQIPVTFTPTSPGTVTWSYRLTWTDAAGTHTVTVPVTGTGVAAPYGQSAIAPPGGGWRLNGAARMSHTSLILTQAAKNQAGSAVYPVPVPSDGLSAQFTVKLGGGTGGNGMTFSLLNPATSTPTSLGGTGWQLGYGGLSGVAVVLDTAKTAGNPSANFAGIATGSSGTSLTFAQTNTHIPALRTGTHTVAVSVSSGTITVLIDGTQYLSAATALPALVLPAFTAATSGITDVHSVIAAAITAGGSPVPPPGGGWSFNATAAMAASGIRLTPVTHNVAGSVVYPVAVPTAGLQVIFNTQVTGGDGVTFALLAPGAAATAVGGVAGDLGFGKLHGLAIALVTHKESGFPSYNFAGISTGTDATGSYLVFQAVARGIPALHTGTHTVAIAIAAGDVVTVTLDGMQVFHRTVPGLPATALLAFTSATGSVGGIHLVRSIAISSSG